MPTPNRQNFVIRKTRVEFKANVGLTDPDAINNAIRLADTNLDSKFAHDDSSLSQRMFISYLLLAAVLVQAEHLTKLMKDPNYQVDI